MDDSRLVVNAAGMSPFESIVFCSVFTGFEEHLDPLTITSALYRSGIIERGLSIEVLEGIRNGESRKVLVTQLVQYIPQNVSFMEVVRCLNACGYREFATRLYLTLIKNKGVINPVQRASPSHKTELFFFSLKIMIHDGQLKNPRKNLRDLAVRFKSRFEIERDGRKQQQIADRYIAILGAEFDAYCDTVGCKSEVSLEFMLQEMREMSPHTSNSSLSDVVYYSRHATFDALRKDYAHADNMLIQGRTRSYTSDTCWEIVNMIYVEVLVKLSHLENNPTAENREAVLLGGSIGLQSVEDLPLKVRSAWRRMFILRMVNGLLGISNSANIIPDYTVSQTHLTQAQDLLAKIDEEWSGIDIRREMFYSIARARVNELLGLNQECLAYLDRASFLAESGQFLAKIPFIKKFRDTVQRNIIDSEAIRMATFHQSGKYVHVRETGFGYLMSPFSLTTDVNDNSITQLKVTATNVDYCKDGIMHSKEIKDALEIEFSQTKKKDIESKCDMSPGSIVYNGLEPGNKEGHNYVQTLTEVKQLVATEVDNESMSCLLAQASNTSLVDDICSSSVNNSFCDFNSVVLFEDRGEPEGISHGEKVFNTPTDTTPCHIMDSTATASDYPEDDFDDEALFGDGINV